MLYGLCLNPTSSSIELHPLDYDGILRVSTFSKRTDILLYNSVFPGASQIEGFCFLHSSHIHALPTHTHKNRWPIIINKIIDLHFGIVPYNVITHSFIYILSFSRPKLLQVQKSRKLAVNCPSLYLFISLIFGYDRLIPLYWSRRQSVASQGKNVGKESKKKILFGRRKRLNRRLVAQIPTKFSKKW